MEPKLKMDLAETHLDKARKDLNCLNNMLAKLDRNSGPSQTIFYLEGHAKRLDNQIKKSCSLKAWRLHNDTVYTIIIPHTSYRELRLTEDARMVIKAIFKLALKAIATDERAIITNLEYDNIFVDKGDLDIWVAAPQLQKWSAIRRDNKCKYLEELGKIVTKFIGEDRPKDIQILIDYLEKFTTHNVHQFNQKVVLCHPSLMCYSRMMLRAEYIYFELLSEIENNGSRNLYNTVVHNFGDIPYHDVTDINDAWMLRVSNNPRMRYLHHLSHDNRGVVTAPPVFGYLIFMKHGVKHLLDNQQKVDTYLVNKGENLQSASWIRRDTADDYLYAMYPEYMSKLIQILIDGDLLSDCWKLHGVQ